MPTEAEDSTPRCAAAVEDPEIRQSIVDLGMVQGVADHGRPGA